MTTRTDFTGSPRTQEQEFESTFVESEAKRRKLRKGTTSCWECKRRKIKCTFASPTDAICIGCHRRGATCINQEFPEGEIISDVRSPTARIKVARNQKVSQHGLSQPKPGITTPNSVHFGLAPGRTPTTYEASEGTSPLEAEVINEASSLLTPVSQLVHTPGEAAPDRSKHERISIALRKACPSQEDANILYEACSSIQLYFYQINTTPQSQLDHEGFRLWNNSPNLLSPGIHPVLLARQMLLLASLLQQCPVESIQGLSEAPQSIMKRLVQTAIDLVTTNEELHGTTEGLECIILEGVFQLECGNLRRSWLAFRRALTVGQLMGIHRPHCPPLQKIDPATKIDPHFVWFRIVYMDRFLSIMLGVPQGTTDKSMGSDAAMAGETPMGILARSHAVIAARIVEQKDNDPFFQDPAPYRAINEELLKVANDLPAKFWLPPNVKLLVLDKSSKEHPWESLRFMNQLYHYNLLCQLHLPSLLRSTAQYDCAYSKMACINAASEILTRCITYSNVTNLENCWWIFAIPASMTLVLAHIDCHRNQELNHILAHQRIRDRVMIKQILENIEDLKETHDHTSSDSSQKGANVLQWLLDIEAAAAEGQNYTARGIHEHEAMQEDHNSAQISIPYFGVIKITCEGLISRESPPLRSASERNGNCHGTGCAVSVNAANRGPDQNQPDTGILPMNPAGMTINPRTESTTPSGQTRPAVEQFPAPGNDFDTQQQWLFPGLTAGVEDWALQGLDNAFFDQVAMGSGVPYSSGNWMPS